MKTLHLFNEINFSGAEIMYASAAPLFAAKGTSIEAWSTGPNKGEYVHVFEENGIKTRHVPTNSPNDKLAVIKFHITLYKHIKKEKVELLHIHRQALFFACFIAFLANAKCVKTQHNVFKNRWWTRPNAILKRWVVSKLFGTVFHSIGKSVHDNEQQYYKNKAVKVNNWYDSKRFFPPVNNDEKQHLREKHKIDKDAYVIVSTGMCITTKNHIDIIRALQVIGKQAPIIYLHLGCGVTEDSEKKLATELGVLDRIQFLGNVENVREYLIVGDTYVMPSKYEGLGNAALEAMACGIPVVLYNVPGLKDLVQNNEGFLITPNHETLAEQLIQCYENDMSDIKQSGLRLVNEEYSIERNVPKMLTLYENA